ncbi:MAG TPA: hypothetical protein VE913_17685 [Longimicrobium sp.]|nr:hypothetical protein [Longimicrobium sp.]
MTLVARWSRYACAAALALAAGCANAAKRYEQGMTLEQRGRLADAARRYIDALEKEPALPGAREGLQRSADLAAAEMIARAAALENAGRAGEAADVFLELDALRGETARVQVRTAVPADYGQRRRAAFDRAVDEAVARSGSAVALSDFGRANQRLERAMRRWYPSPEQRAALDRARFDTQAGWAEAELRAGLFRAAHERAAAAARTAAPESQDVERVFAVQREALRLGTVSVAVMPVGARAAERERLPADFLAALNDELELNRWSRPPLFVRILDTREVRGSARRHGYPRDEPTTSDVVSLGRQLGARFVIVPVIDSVEVSESGVRETRRPVRTRASADTAFTLRQGRHTLRARIAYRVVDVEERHPPDTGWLWSDATDDFREARYAGDWRDLVLPARDRALFEPRREDRGVARRLTSELATTLERETFDRMVREVP